MRQQCWFSRGLCPWLLPVFSHGLPYPTRLLCPWNCPGKNTGVGCRSLFQGIFLTAQGLNPRLLRWQVGSFPLSHLGSLKEPGLGANSGHSALTWGATALGSDALWDGWKQTSKLEPGCDWGLPGSLASSRRAPRGLLAGGALTGAHLHPG